MNFFVYLGILIIVTVVIFAIWAAVSGWLGFMNDDASKWQVALTLLILFLSPFFAFLGLSRLQIYPPRLFEKQLRDRTMTQSQVEAIGSKGKELIAAFEKPEQLTLQQMRDLIDELRKYASEATALARAQDEQIARLRQAVDESGKKAREAETLAITMKLLTSEQLDAVKFLITNDANEQSTQYFLYGALVSFPIGVVSSVLASALWDRFKGRRMQLFGTSSEK
jgi:hypothetical protein